MLKSRTGAADVATESADVFAPRARLVRAAVDALRAKLGDNATVTAGTWTSRMSGAGGVHPYGPTVALDGCNQHPKCPSAQKPNPPPMAPALHPRGSDAYDSKRQILDTLGSRRYKKESGSPAGGVAGGIPRGN